jgi:hypothetical protein
MRWKKNVVEIDNALDKVLKLRGVSFDWDKAHGGQHTLGFIAEEVGELMPEAVDYDDASKPANHYKGKDGKDRVYATTLYSDRILPMLVQAIKEQQKQIEEQKKINKELKARLDKLEAK